LGVTISRDQMSLTRSSINRIPSLDGLRAFSILCVVVGHFALKHRFMPQLAIFGVQVFFVISGYLITTLLLKEHQRNGRISLAAFYTRRSFRIFPAAFTYIAVVALLAPSARPDLPYALTYTMGYHAPKTSNLLEHLWSLSCEEQFYLIWPLALVLGFRHRGRIAVATIVIAALFRMSCCASGVEPLGRILHFYFPSVMDSIAAGCLLAIYYPQIRERCSGMIHNAGIVLALLILTVFTAVALGSVPVIPGSRAVALLVGFWGIVPLLIAFGMFLLIERRDWILNNPVASVVGLLSYSLYLWQQPFIFAGGSSRLLSLALLFGLAAASYTLVEHPMLKLGARLGKPGRFRTPASGEVSQ
jgi:peptidoglycan/LPS O-acetylase OafA/YrhL